MSTDWFDYQAAKMAPKPAYQRAMPKREPELEAKVEPILVEESDASASMIQRIIGKIRGD